MLRLCEWLYILSVCQIDVIINIQTNKHLIILHKAKKHSRLTDARDIASALKAAYVNFFEIRGDTRGKYNRGRSRRGSLVDIESNDRGQSRRGSLVSTSAKATDLRSKKQINYNRPS